MRSNLHQAHLLLGPAAGLCDASHDFSWHRASNQGATANQINFSRTSLKSFFDIMHLPAGQHMVGCWAQEIGTVKIYSYLDQNAACLSCHIDIGVDRIMQQTGY